MATDITLNLGVGQVICILLFSQKKVPSHKPDAFYKVWPLTQVFCHGAVHAIQKQSYASLSKKAFHSARVTSVEETEEDNVLHQLLWGPSSNGFFF